MGALCHSFDLQEAIVNKIYVFCTLSDCFTHVLLNFKTVIKANPVDK